MAQKKIGNLLIALLPIMAFYSGAHAVDSDHVDEFEPIKAAHIVKGNFVFGVPNVARFGGSYHRILHANGRLMYTLGGGGNIGVAVADQGAVGQKFSVQESYGNMGVLPGIHLMSADRSILLGLNAIIGVQYGSIEISNPKFLSRNEIADYQISSQMRKELNIHAGLEAGIYYFANPILMGVELGFVATPRSSIPYSINQNNTATTYDYNMPAVRYSGVRISITAGCMF